MSGLSRRPISLCVCLVCLVVPSWSCASRSGVAVTADDVDVDHLFTVVVLTEGTGCAIKVDPDSGNDARVKAGSKVGWNLVNLCDTSRDMTLEFTFKSSGQKKDILKETRWSSDQRLFQGKIKKRWFGDCATYDEAPCGVYKYSVKVGSHSVDPEIEIVY